VGQSPLPLDGGFGSFKQPRYFFHRATDKVAQLDDPAFPRILSGQFAQRLIERQQINRFFDRDRWRL